MSSDGIPLLIGNKKEKKSETIQKHYKENRNGSDTLCNASFHAGNLGVK